MHIKNGTGEFEDFPNQMYTGKSDDDLTSMEIYGIVFGVLCAAMLIATIITLIHRHKTRREKKSVFALVQASRRDVSGGPADGVPARSEATSAPAPPPPPTSKPSGRLDIHAEESDKEASSSSSSSESEEEPEQFQSSDDKLRFVMDRWMKVMKEKQGTQLQPRARPMIRVSDENDDRPAPVKRWARIIERINVEQGQLPKDNAFPRPQRLLQAVAKAATNTSTSSGVTAESKPPECRPEITPETTAL